MKRTSIFLFIIFIFFGCSSEYKTDVLSAAPEATTPTPLSPTANSDMSGVNMKSSLGDCGFILFSADGFRSLTAWGYLKTDSFDSQANAFLDNGYDGVYSSALEHIKMNPTAVTADILCTDDSDQIIAFKSVGDNSRSHFTISQKIRIINEILCQANTINLDQLLAFSSGVDLPAMPMGWLNGMPEDQCD